ncbi:MAG: hypothetical protein P4L87_22985, partial [Formivibrio sp.]|nr:hypothetical protein [Formivibrio sp.]
MSLEQARSIPKRRESTPADESFEQWSKGRIERCTREQAEYVQAQQRLADEAGKYGTTADFMQRLAARIYSPSVKPEEPATRFYVANTVICTPGNLTTISAQAKAGKSAAIGAMIASTFAADGADCLGFVSENPE